MKLRAVSLERCIGCGLCMFACARHRFGSVSITKSAVHVRTHGGLHGMFVVIVCRACPDPPCVKACPTGALVRREGGGCRLEDEGKCIACGRCAKSCIIGALTLDENGRPIPCLHCGVCARYCPHGVLKLVP